MFIFVGCAGGGTSSLFCQRVSAAVNAAKLDLTASFSDLNTINENPAFYQDQADLVFAYGGIDAIRSSTAFEFGQLYDVILVAPQVRYLAGKKRELMQRYPTVVADIPPKIFGTMNGPVAMMQTLEILREIDDRHGSQAGLSAGTKQGDKNPEILVLGSDHHNPIIRKVLKNWEQAGLRSLVEPYNMEALYDFKPKNDFDLRWLFGSFTDLTTKDLPRLARRIDGLLVFSVMPERTLRKKQQWLNDYHIPTLILPSKAQEHRADVAQLSATMLNFIQIVTTQTQATSEITVSALEKPVPPAPKKSWGIFSWQ